MYSPERSRGNDRENQEKKESWKWKEFQSDKGVLHLTSDAKKLDYGTIEVVFDDVRSFIKEKPEILHTGSDGSVYVLESGEYLLKEQKSDGKELMEEHEKWQEFIQRDAAFPKDVHLIDYLALVEPPYLPEDEFGRRRQLPSFEDHQTEVAVGSGDFTRKANICSYVIMPFVGNGIDLGKLKRYNEKEDSLGVAGHTVDRMIEKGIIANAGEAEKFADEQLRRIRSALEHASGSSNLDMRDFAHRNIVVDTDSEKPQFYLIDL